MMKIPYRILLPFLIPIYLFSLLAKGVPEVSSASPHSSPADNLETALQTSLSNLLNQEYPGIALLNLHFDGKVLQLNLSQLSFIGTATFSELLSSIDRQVHEVLTAHQLGEPHNLEYFIQIEGKPLYPIYPFQHAPKATTGVQGKKIVLSPGHGWYDTGSGWALQRGDHWGIVEDFINADLVMQLQALLSSFGADLRPTRELNKNAGNHESGHPWWEMDASEYIKSIGAPWSIWHGGYEGMDRDIVARPEYANWIDADAMISLHNNGGGGCGTETWYDTSNAYAAQSQQLANLVHNKLIERLQTQWDANWCNRGVKGSNGAYGENRRFNGPAIIVELAFMDHQSDNAALQNATFRTVAMLALRDALLEYFGSSAAVDDYNGDGRPDIYAIDKEGEGTNSTEIHVLSGADDYQTWLLRTGTPQHQTGQTGEWAFGLADYNGDGLPDLYTMDKEGQGTNSTEIHILSGADGYQTWLLHTGTPQHQTGQTGEWAFGLADYNGDGKPDLYAIDKEGVGTNSTEVHILSGADGYQTWLLRTGTPQHQTGQTAEWAFGLADYNGDGKPDLYAIDKEGTGTNSTEVHILNGADAYQTWLLHTGTPQHQTGQTNEWTFGLADYNGDGKPDLYAIDKEGEGTNSTEVHILSGSDGYQTWLLHTGTPQHMTGLTCEWDFATGGDCVAVLDSVPFKVYLPAITK